MATNWKQKFLLIWSGQFVSLLSSSVVNFAIVLWLSLETGSAQVLAIAAIAALLPQTLAGPFTGVLIDRWNRKRTMMLADLFVAFCTLALAILLYLHVSSAIYIYALLALRSLGSAFHMPAMQASVPLLAPETELTRVNGINQVIQSVSVIAGPALAALLIAVLNIEQILLLDVAGAILACLSLVFVTIPNPERETGVAPHFATEMKEAVSAVRVVKGMPWLMFFSVTGLLFIMPISVLFPLMTLEHFNGTPFQISLIEIVWGVGMLIGGAVMGFRHYKVNQVGLLNGANILLGLTFILSGVLPSSAYTGFVVFTIIGGVAGTVYQTTFMTLLQRKIDPAVLGRVISTYFSVSLLPSLIGLLGTGFLADTIGLGYSFVLSGLLLSLIGLIAFFVPSLWKLGRQTPGNTTI